ncbi:MAG: hypothetical protein COA67_11790 [Lutibacter sp.]|nr:MAG: hypothetical protein COA67_11790 [Lutibacter sp.]
MKLLKGILTIALISVIAVSCKDAKKDVDAVKDGVEVVEGDAKDADAATAHKCDATCKKDGCTYGEKADHKCDESCKKDGCKAGEKCDTKCGEADCKGEACLKCAEKKAECKVKCAAKKAAADAEKATGDVKDAVKEGAEDVKEGAEKLEDAVKKVIK